MNDIKRLFGKAVDSAEKASITHGYLGRFLLDGSEQVEVPGQPDIVWVRVGTAETDINVTRARNVGVPLIFGLPVKMKLVNGQYRIIDIDHDRLDIGENPPVGITNSVWGLVDTPYDPGDNPGKILIVAGTNLVFDNANNHIHDHTLLTNIGTNTHVQIDTHIADATLHFTQGSIDHTLITNIGTNTHAQIDTHIADATIHFTQSSIDHTAITNIGTNSHAAIDTHIANAAIHFTQGSIDHTAITNIGTNTHAQIDTHIANAAIHFTEASIVHNNLSGLTTGDPHTQYLLLAGRSGGQTILGNVGIGVTPSATVDLEVQASTGGVLALSRPGEIVAGNHIGKLDFYSYDASDAGIYAGIVAGIRVLAETTFGGGANNANTNMLFFTNPGTTPLAPTEKMRITSGGNVGIGVASPQGRLHGYDGTGGFLHVTKTGVGGTAVTVIPDGTGDVVHGIRVMAVCKPSTGGTQTVESGTVPGGSVILYISGSDQFALDVSAGGAVTVVRTGGSLTYTVSLWMTWL